MGAAAVFSASACAASPIYNPSELPADQLGQVADICQSVIGLQPGEEHFVRCLESLSASARGVEQGQAMQRAERDCLAERQPAGSPALAECVLQNSERAKASDPVPQFSRIDATRPVGRTKSYFYTSPRETFHREQLACARLGLDPAQAAFGSCVAGLEAGLSAADDPMN
jgi:hypothetical protein